MYSVTYICYFVTLTVKKYINLKVVLSVMKNDVFLSRNCGGGGKKNKEKQIKHFHWWILREWDLTEGEKQKPPNLLKIKPETESHAKDRLEFVSLRFSISMWMYVCT